MGVRQSVEARDESLAGVYRYEMTPYLTTYLFNRPALSSLGPVSMSRLQEKASKMSPQVAEGYRKGMEDASTLYFKNIDRINHHFQQKDQTYRQQIAELQNQIQRRMVSQQIFPGTDASYDRYAVEVIDGKQPCFDELDAVHTCLRREEAVMGGDVVLCNGLIEKYAGCSDKELAQ